MDILLMYNHLLSLHVTSYESIGSVFGVCIQDYG